MTLNEFENTLTQEQKDEMENHPLVKKAAAEFKRTKVHKSEVNTPQTQEAIRENKLLTYLMILRHRKAGCPIG